MPWSFNSDLPKCDVFAQFIADAPPGQEHIWSGVDGLEEVQPGIFRVNTASAVLTGTLRVSYPGWPDYEQTGFSDKNGHTDIHQAGPAGYTILTPVTPVVWYCAYPRGDRKLDYAYIEADTGPQSFTPTVDPTFVVPVIGSCTIGGQKLNRYEIGRRSPASQIDLNVDEDGSVIMFIWER